MRLQLAVKMMQEEAGECVATVHCIKKLTFYVRSTATGTGLLWIQLRDCYGAGTGVALAILLRTRMQQDGGLRSARRFRTFVGSRTGTDHAERKCHFE